jgi:ATP-dependent Clp protease adaptor protein ClpS
MAQQLSFNASAMRRGHAACSAPQMAGEEPPKSPGKGDDEGGNATLLEPKTRLKKPSMYRVLLLNDDYTPMEFVVRVLMSIFKKSQGEAEKIMLHVHQHGVGQCGVYTYEVAETKVHRVLDYARRNNHPLQCTMEAD